MRRLNCLQASTLAAALAVSACAGTITTINNDLATLSNNSIPAACGIVTVAEGYFNELKPTISASNQAIEAKAAAAVNVLCQNPPSNITQALADLAAEWLLIQNATVSTPPPS